MFLKQSRERNRYIDFTLKFLSACRINDEREINILILHSSFYQHVEQTIFLSN